MAKHSEKGETPAMEAKAHPAGFLKSAASKASRFGRGKRGKAHGKSGKSSIPGGKY
jgi:hypothetical protein